MVNRKRALQLVLAATAVFLGLAGVYYWHTSKSLIPETWLVEKVSLAELEQQEWTRGNLADEWKALKEQMRAGDEIWYYKSPPRLLADESGFALVRDRRVIAKVVVFMS